MPDALQRLLDELGDSEAGSSAETRIHETAEALLAVAQQSDTKAHRALQRLHGILVPERTRAVGLKLARQVWKRSLGREDGLRALQLDITIGIAHHRLDILLLPSVFAPEAWGTTFLEGLLRKPADEYRDSVLVELGCGSGWISIALGKFTELGQLYGLDINPHAPLVSEVNAILNSYDDWGAPLYDSRRRLLYEKISFRTSDLLQAVREHNLRADYIIGSIPQVPKPDLAPPSPDADPQALYDLSNYFELQGVHEDRHGLGLIAQALDEAVSSLEPWGRVIFNLAGRPGTQVIERMFTKRGYVPHVLWASRIAQAEDTDIAELAALERRTGSDFEFYQHRTSREPISAEMARLWHRAGGSLWHDLLVYEATLRHPRERIMLSQTLGRMGLLSLSRQIDLSSANAGQLVFAQRVASRLHRKSRIPYVHEQGSPGFRQKLAAYLQKFVGFEVASEELWVGPNRQAALYALFTTLADPADAVLVSRNLVSLCAPAARRAGVRLLVGNNTLNELLELGKGLRPRLIALRTEETELHNETALRDLVSLGIPIVFDETGRLRLAPRPFKNDMLALLSTRPNGHTIVLSELQEDSIYEELRLALAMGPAELMHALALAGEATYCRIGHLQEHYFHHLLEHALAFHIELGQAQLHASSVKEESPTPDSRGNGTGQDRQRLPVSKARLSSRLERLAKMPVFQPPGAGPAGRELIRLDYGENDYPVPGRLAAGLLVGLLEPAQAGLLPLVRHSVAAWLRETRRSVYSAQEIAIGAGVVPLLSDLIVALHKRLGRPPRIVLPRGYYGLFPAILDLAGARARTAQSSEEHGYKLEPSHIGDADMALITHPGNPTGSSYSRSEIEALAQAVPLLVVDEIYGLLADLEQREPFFSAAELGDPHVLVLGGLSKEFASGGLRIGFAASKDLELLASIESNALVRPDRFALRATEFLFSVYRNDEPGVVHGTRAEVDDYMRTLRAHLAAQGKALAEALGAAGMPARLQSGVFLFPAVKNDDQIEEVLRERAGLLVNRGSWAGTPGHLRVIYSIEPRRFEEALGRLRHMGSITQGNDKKLPPPRSKPPR